MRSEHRLRTGTASLAWASDERALAIGPFDATGDFTVTGSAALTADLPLGRVIELRITITDRQSGVTDLVYPVVGETP